MSTTSSSPGVVRIRRGPVALKKKVVYTRAERKEMIRQFGGGVSARALVADIESISRATGVKYWFRRR